MKSGSNSNAALADKLNNSFKNQMKAEMIMNNADAVVQSLTSGVQPQDLASPRQNAPEAAQA